MSLSQDVQKVFLVHPSRNYIESMQKDQSTEEQQLTVNYASSSLYMVDSQNSVPHGDNFIVQTRNVTTRRHKLRLLSTTLSTNLPNINKFNNNVRIFYNIVGDPIVNVINFDLEPGYYSRDDLVLELAVKSNNSVPANAALIWDFTSPGLYFTFSATSNTANRGIDKNKIEVTLPNQIVGGDLYEFQFDPKCSFIKNGANLCHFSSDKFINGYTVLSGVCNMVYTRYLKLKSKELMKAYGNLTSFDGKNDVNDLVAIIDHGDIRGSSYRTVSTGVDFVISTKSQNLNFIEFEMTDEFDNVLNFGPTGSVGDLNSLSDNQILLQFSAHS